MINQKAISAKIDEKLLQELDEYLKHKWMKRNTAINQALGMWLDARRAREDDMTYERQGNEPSPLVIRFMNDYLTFRAKFYLDLTDYH